MHQCSATFSSLQVTNVSCIGRTTRTHIPISLDLRSLHRGPYLSDAAAGVAGDEDADTSLIRDEWIRQQLELRSNEYCSKREIMYVLPILLASYLSGVFGRIESESGHLMSMDEPLHPAWPPGLDDKYLQRLQTRTTANLIY